MWTKQSQGFCPACGRTTNHVTHYHKDDGGTLVARVHCAECREPSGMTARHHSSGLQWKSTGVGQSDMST